MDRKITGSRRTRGDRNRLKYEYQKYRNRSVEKLIKEEIQLRLTKWVR